MELFALSGMACDITLTQTKTLQKCMYPKMVRDYSVSCVTQNKVTNPFLRNTAQNCSRHIHFKQYHTLPAHAHGGLPV